MALQIPFDETATGARFPDAYHRITQIQYNVGSHTSVVVAIYKDADAYAAGKQPITMSSFVVKGQEFSDLFGVAALDKANPVKQGYVYLKRQAAYGEAADV